LLGPSWRCGTPPAPGAAQSWAADGQPAAPASFAERFLRTTTELTVPYRVDLGDEIKLIGSAIELGRWDIKKAVELEWHEGDLWTCQLQLPAGAHEYKVRGLWGPRRGGRGRCGAASEAAARTSARFGPRAACGPPRRAAGLGADQAAAAARSSSS
jgi:hypothetical protein